jgi:uncharacterized protein YfaT (DUF1175 family)
MPRRCCLFLLLRILTTAATITLLVSCTPKQTTQHIALHLQPTELPADGYSQATLTINRTQGVKASKPPLLKLSDSPYSAHLGRTESTSNGWRTRIRAGILPGEVTITVVNPSSPITGVTLRLQPATADRFRDGTPDFLRLDDPTDQLTFRRWFTFLAEIQYFTPAPDRSAEIVDCSALLRYAYREALRRHDARWCGSSHLPLIPAMNSVEKYSYPQTPLGADLFRLCAGPFTSSDLSNPTFGQFASAETLQKFNTFFISRDITRVRPGDLLFYCRPTERIPFHSMIFLGRSQITEGKANYVVYDTGPDGTKAGEIRRRPLEELLNYPDPQWQPKWTNPHFLGVFRWNILRATS